MNVISPKIPSGVGHGRIPPGPRGNAITGNAIGLQHNILDFVTKIHELYGSPARVRLLPNYYGYLLSDPSDYKHVLQENSQVYAKEVLHFDILSLLIGRSVVTLNGSLWRQRRRLAQPAFHSRRIAALSQIMTSLTQDLIASWDERPPGTVVDMEAEMTRLTLRIASKTLLNVEFEGALDSVGRAFADVNRYLSARWVNPFALWSARIPTRSNRDYRNAMQTLDSAVFKIIAERRTSGDDPGDFLSMLLSARDEETGEGLTDLGLRDEVMTILIAGHETSSTALSWTWYLLSQHPEAEEKMHRELDTVLAGRPPEIGDLANLPYTTNVFNEALRLYPPAYVIGRKALLEDRIGGYEIPRGANVYLVPYVTHRRADLWERPLAFEPERFDEERSRGRPQYAYIPFGGGPRRCLGDTFADTESRLILATIGQRYRPVLCADQPVEPKPLVTIRPRHGLRMKLESRA
jgi:cytochrome P450